MGAYDNKAKQKKMLRIYRIFFSVPGYFFIVFMIALTSGMDNDGIPISIEERIAMIITFYLIFFFPLNLVIRFVQHIVHKESFLSILDKPLFWREKFYIHDYKICLNIYNDIHNTSKKLLPIAMQQVFIELDTFLKSELSKATHYADIANTSTCESDFYSAFDMTLRILRNMQRFEKYSVFPDGNTPSEDIYRMELNKQDSINKLHERIKHENDITHPNYDLMDGHQFEHFCAELLTKNGFNNVSVTPESGDHGIDILAEKDDITYAIQCKCYSSNIGNAAIQQAHTGKSLYHKDIAVVLTNQYFTAQAKEEADALGVKLWDRDKLNDMIEKSSLNTH